MQTKEVWEIRYGQISVQDKELRSKIADMVKHDIATRTPELQKAIQSLVEEFIEQHYSQQELEVEIKYDIILFKDGYTPHVSVFVFPVSSPDIQKYRNVINGGYTYYTYSSYVKERNVLGELVKTRLSIYEAYNTLLEEKIELEKKLKEAEERIKELEERLGEQQEEDP